MPRSAARLDLAVAQGDPVIKRQIKLVVALGPEELAALKFMLELLAAQPVPVPPKEEREQVSWGSGGPTDAHERAKSSRQWTVKLGLWAVAEAWAAQMTPRRCSLELL